MMASIKVEFPRRQAMLLIGRVPVLVWPMPTQDGCFIVEHQDGHCQKVQPYELIFLGSKELFDQCSWEEA